MIAYTFDMTVKAMNFRLRGNDDYIGTGRRMSSTQHDLTYGSAIILTLSNPKQSSPVTLCAFIVRAQRPTHDPDRC